MAKRADLDFTKSKEFSSYEDMLIQALYSVFSAGSNVAGHRYLEGEMQEIYDKQYLDPKTFSPDFVAALLGNINAESNLNPFAYNPNDGDSGHSSSGLFQHHKVRETEMKNFMIQAGFDKNRLENLFLGLEQPTMREVERAMEMQLMFAFHFDKPDLDYSSTLRDMTTSSSTEELTKGFSSFERYDGWNKPNSEEYKTRRDTILNYQTTNRKLVNEIVAKKFNTKTYDREAARVGAGQADNLINALVSNTSFKTQASDGLLSEERLNKINNNVMRKAIANAWYNENKGKEGYKSWKNATTEEKQDFITSGFDEDRFRKYLAHYYANEIDNLLKGSKGSYDNEYLRAAAREKIFTQIANTLPTSFGGNDGENVLAEMLGTNDESSVNYGLNISGFYDSFIEDFLEETGSINRLHRNFQAVNIGGIGKEGEGFTDEMVNPKTINEYYRELFKNSYTEEEIKRIERVSGQTIEEIFDGYDSTPVTLSTVGTVAGGGITQAVDLGLIATNTNRLLDASQKLEYLQSQGIENLPETEVLTQEQVDAINASFETYKLENPEQSTEFLLSQQGIDTPYWERPGFNPDDLSDEAKEKYYLDAENAHVVVRNGDVVVQFNTPMEKNEWLAQESSSNAEGNEENNTNNAVNVEEEPEKKGFWDSLGEVGDKLSKTLGLVKKITDQIGGPGTLVTAALGREAYHDAMKEIKPLELPGVSDMFKQHLHQVQQLSKMGFSPSEAQKHRKDIDSAYKRGIENAVRGTAGDRAKFLANSGILDSQRASALLDFAATDAEIQRSNLAQYGQALQFHEDYNYRKAAQERSDDLQEQIRNKQGASNFAQLAFQQITDNINDQSSIYENMFYNKLQNQINQNTNNPLVGLNFPGSGTEAGQIGD